MASAFACALYARVEWPWLVFGWIGLVPWLAALDRTTSLRGTLALALLMCVAFVLAVFSWFASAIQSYTGASWPVALLVVVVLAPVLQPQLISFAVGRWLARRLVGEGFWYVTLVGACVYVGTEWALPKLFADTLGHGLYASALMRQAADVAGAPGLTFVLLVANECVVAALWAAGADAPQRRRGRAVLARVGAAPALVLLLVVYGEVRYAQLGSAAPPGAAVSAAVVQADISQYDRLAAEIGKFEAVRTILNAHFALSTQALAHGGVDLVVWPETVYPTTFGSPKSAAGADFDHEIGAFVNAADVPLVFGAYDVDHGDEFNAAVFLEPSRDGRLRFATYRKASLFPLTERVPAWLNSERVRRWLPWMGTWKPGRGTNVVPFRLRDGRTLLIAPLICYDAIDPNRAIAAVRRGADLIVTLSNDSWFAAGGGPRLHLVVSAFRSLETRRPQIRATNTGISAIITPMGELLDTLAVHQRGTLVASVIPTDQAWTLMLLWGDWFGPVAMSGAAALLALAFFRAPSGGCGR